MMIIKQVLISIDAGVLESIQVHRVLVVGFKGHSITIALLVECVGLQGVPLVGWGSILLVLFVSHAIQDCLLF